MKAGPVGNFNYDGRITPENVDTLFTHVYYAGYNDWLAAGYLDRETNDFIIPRADVEKMFTKAFTGSPEGLTAAAAYHPETDTFQYGAQGYGGGGPGRYWYEESIDSDGNTVIRFRPEFSDVCAHCNNPTYTCHHNIELVLAPDGRMVSIKLLPREIRLGKYLRATYVVGESLDVEGATIRVLYDDKRSEEIPLTADMVSGYDPEKLGRQTLRVSYGGQYVPFDVMVADEGSVKGLRIYGDTLLLEQGESLDGFSVYLSIYYGDEEISIPLTTDMVSDYDPEKLGRQTLTVSYGGLTTTLEVEVFSHEEAAEKKAFYEKVSWLVGIYYCMAHEGPSVGESFVGWSPENMRFTGKLTEANQEALLQTIVWDKGFEIVDKDLLPPPEGVSGSGYYGYFFKVSEDSMHRLEYYDALVYDFPSLMALSCYRPEANCFLVPFVDGWGGPSHEIARYATVTQKENGNWLIQQRKPSPDAGQWEGFGEEIYQFDMEITQDYRLVSFEIIMEKLTWKTPPAKTVYEKGEALDLSGAVITAHHGTGKSFDIPVTPDMVSGYDPEKSGKQTLTVTYGGRQITFDVTVAAEAENTPPIAIDDEKTGIKLETDDGVVPPDTVIQAEPVTEGGNFTIVNDALAQTSRKWVAYDISLLSDNVKIQPSGKVKITMPVPKGMNKNKMALFHVAEDGTLTQIPFALDETKDHLIFETDHFSLYAVAETDDANPSTGDGGQGALPWVAGLLLLAGAAILLMRKRPAVR